MTDINRHIKAKLLRLLKDSPIVFLNGPRQAGKSTLVQKIAQKEFDADYVTFDSSVQIAGAMSDPTNYLINRNKALIIDEVQLVPEIFRALKITIDELRINKKSKVVGRFLLTGSANIMALPQLSNALVGRMSLLTLYPISASEALGNKGNFIDKIFKKIFKNFSKKADLINIINLATYPEISGASVKKQNSFFDGYITTILQRDVRNISKIDKLNILPNLLRILANRAGNLINDADIARDVGLGHVTTRNYKTLLKMLFLTIEIKPWYRNISKRLVKAPKGYLIDTKLLCYLLGYDLKEIEKNRPEVFGHILENFVAVELLKLITFSDETLDLFHFRTSDNKEVDFVIEKSNGQLVAIEVKKTDNITKSDFKSLLELQKLTKDDFSCGIVFYTGLEVVSFSDKLFAVPIQNLWQ